MFVFTCTETVSASLLMSTVCRRPSARFTTLLLSVSTSLLLCSLYLSSSSSSQTQSFHSNWYVIKQSKTAADMKCFQVMMENCLCIKLQSYSMCCYITSVILIAAFDGYIFLSNCSWGTVWLMFASQNSCEDHLAGYFSIFKKKLPNATEVKKYC